MTEAEKMAITKYDLYYESRMTKVEAIVESLAGDMKEIKADLRWLLGVIGAVGLIIVGVMAHGFKWF